MNTHTSHHLCCRQCRFFQPEGHYHGNCRRMNVSVSGEWQACSLVLSAFAQARNFQPVAA
jgi:hypothetical protein